MKSNETVQAVREMTYGQHKDIIATLIGGVPEDLTFDEAENITRAKGALVSRITEAILACAGRNGKLHQAEVAPPRAVLRLISGGKKVTIPTCEGTRTIAQSASVFTGYLDRAFEKLETRGRATPATDTEVYEMAQNAKFSELFGSLSTDLDRLVFTDDQVVTFCEKHRDWLRTDGYGTFFLLKDGDQFFVAYVYVYVRGELEVRLYHFENASVWRAGGQHRVVVPLLH